jgi:hypothetical protein
MENYDIFPYVTAISTEDDPSFDPLLQLFGAVGISLNAHCEDEEMARELIITTTIIIIIIIIY